MRCGQWQKDNRRHQEQKDEVRFSALPPRRPPGIRLGSLTLGLFIYVTGLATTSLQARAARSTGSPQSSSHAVDQEPTTSSRENAHPASVAKVKGTGLQAPARTLCWEKARLAAGHRLRSLVLSC